MAKRLPWMPFYMADWLLSSRVSVMTIAQKGAYFQLLCHAWMNEDCGYLPSLDPKEFQELSGWLDFQRLFLLSNESKMVQNPFWGDFDDVMAMFDFDEDKDQYYSKRMRKEYIQAEEVSKRSSDKSRKAANTRWGKGKEEPDANAMLTHDSGNADASSEQCLDMPSDAHIQLHKQLQLDKKEKKEKSKSTSKLRKKIEYSEDFQEFWGKCPVNIGKGAAYEEWNKLLAEGYTPETIIAALPQYAAYVEDRRRKDPDNTPLHPRTWLHQRRFEDGPPADAVTTQTLREELRSLRPTPEQLKEDGYSEEEIVYYFSQGSAKEA